MGAGHVNKQRSLINSMVTPINTSMPRSPNALHHGKHPLSLILILDSNTLDKNPIRLKAHTQQHQSAQRTQEEGPDVLPITPSTRIECGMPFEGQVEAETTYRTQVVR